LAKASVNIAYYGRSENSLLQNGIDYNLEGWGFIQELMFRIQDTDVFLGGNLPILMPKVRLILAGYPSGLINGRSILKMWASVSYLITIPGITYLHPVRA